MRYVAMVPPPPLDGFIDDLYCLSGVPRHRVMNVPPMPSAHLFINLGDPVLLREVDPSRPPAVMANGWFMGVWTRRFLIEYPAQVCLAGAHFKPWGLSAFADVPAGELRDRWLPVESVWGRWADGLRDRIGTLTSPAAALRVLADELRARFAERPSRGRDLVRYTAGRLASSRGAARVASLTDTAGVSGSHLATQFKTHIGVTPKRLARIYRFAELILAVDPMRPIDWAGVAQAAGFFDQAHFSREFKDFTGHTPTQYQALRRRLPAAPGYPPDRGPMPAV